MGDPVLAWADIQDDPSVAAATTMPAARAGWCGSAWAEAAEIVAAAHVHTIARTDPTARRLLADPGDVDGQRTPPGRGSSNCSAAR